MIHLDRVNDHFFSVVGIFVLSLLIVEAAIVAVVVSLGRSVWDLLVRADPWWIILPFAFALLSIFILLAFMFHFLRVHGVPAFVGTAADLLRDLEIETRKLKQATEEAAQTTVALRDEGAKFRDYLDKAARSVPSPER